MPFTLHNLHLHSVAAALPPGSLDLTTLADEFDEKEIGRIIASTGIRRIRVAPPGLCASDLCQAAAEQLFEQTAVDRSSIDAVVFVSQTPDWRMPGTAPAMQARLGLRNNIASFDLNYGCSGFVYGLLQAAMLVTSGAAGRVLVCAGDVLTPYVHPRDKALRAVIGDAGSAAIVDRGDDSWCFTTGTDGTGGDKLIVPAGGARTPSTPEPQRATEREHGNVRSDEHLYMDGMEIMKFALREVPPAVDAVLAAAGWTREDVGFYGFHQANKFILEYVARKMRLPLEKVPIAVAETGNTNPASIPLMLSLEHERLRAENRLDRVVLCGFGVGFSWAAMTCSLAETRLIAPINA